MSKPIYDNDLFFKNYLNLRNKEYNYNEHIEVPNILSLIGDFKDKTILDIGCGYGLMSHFFATNGAKRVVGIDISNNMIEKAKKEYSADNIEYQIVSCENIDQIKDNFDTIYSSLCFHYVEDFDKLFHDIAKLLNNGGRLVFSMEHPMMTATIDNNKWIRDDDGNYRYYVMDSYSVEGKRKVKWLDTNVTKYHHTVSTVINLLINNGFIIEKVLEPTIPQKLLKKNITMQKDIHRPSYLMVSCVKR